MQGMTAISDAGVLGQMSTPVKRGSYNKKTYGERRHALCEVFLGVSAKVGKLFNYVGHKRIHELLIKYHHFDIAERTLCRDIKKMEDEGLFLRQNRNTRRGIESGRYYTCLYYLKRKIFKYAARLKKWATKVESLFHTPILACNRSQRENEILKIVAKSAKPMWKSPLEGKASPVFPDG